MWPMQTIVYFALSFVVQLLIYIDPSYLKAWSAVGVVDTKQNL